MSGVQTTLCAAHVFNRNDETLAFGSNVSHSFHSLKTSNSYYKVNKFMEIDPFNFTNPLGYFGGVKQIRAEAAYLYDAVHLYANALAKVLKSGQSARNGTAIVDAIKGSRYLSAMGYMVQIDENGDAGGNYTLLAEDVVSHLNETVYGLVPIGTFSPPAEDSRRGPQLELFSRINWVGDGPPLAEPECGFRGEKCISYTGEISAGITGSSACSSSSSETELESLLWEIDFGDIQMKS